MNSSVPGQSTANTFIILDGARINAPLVAYQYDDAPFFDPLYRGTQHAGALEVSPCLVRPSAGSRLWDHQSEWGAFGVGLRTNASADELISHLRSLISVRLPNGQLSYCRFYSNKQLPLLLGVFSEQESRSFSGPVSSWFSTHPTSPFHDVHLDGNGHIQMAADEGWFQLKVEHVDALNRAKDNEFSNKLCQHLGVQPELQTIEVVKRLQAQARENGFISEREVATFVELAWDQDERLKSSVCQQILNDTDRTPYQKLTALDHQLGYGNA